MNKFTVIECYLCPKKRSLVYVVKDTITDELLYLTEFEWREKENQQYSNEDVEAWRQKKAIELAAFTHTSKKGGKHGKRK